MDIRKLQRVIVDGLEDVKANNIVVFNTEHLSSLFERVIVASGTSNRQTKALASAVREEVKKAGYPLPRLEGEANGEWIIVDCGAAVVHVMQPAIREYYHLEEIWGDKPVNMKIASAPRKLVKAEAAAAAPAAKKGGAAAKKAPARKTATRKVAAKKAPAKKTATKATKAPAKKASSAKKTATRTAVKKAPVKKTTKARALGTAAAKKSSAKKTATKATKAPARKTSAAKKTATRTAKKS